MTLRNPGTRNRSLLLFVGLLFGACGGGGGGSGGGGVVVPAGVELASLLVSTGDLSPTFSAQTTSYVVGPALLSDAVRVTATVREAGATVRVANIVTASGSASFPIDLGPGATSVPVRVTAADGSVSATYTIVFLRGGPGAQEALVKASNTGGLDNFGTVVSLSGDTLVVGAPFEDGNGVGVNPGPVAEASDNGPNSGAVYVFVRSGGTWVQQAYLKASNAEGGDFFGSSVAVSGDTLVVGAPGEDSEGRGANLAPVFQLANQGSESGAVYVFLRRGTVWTQQAYLKSSNSDIRDEFGSAVAVSLDTLVVGTREEASAATGVNPGAAAEADNLAGSSGAAYVFVRSGSTWTQQAYLKASNAEAGDFFGHAVAIAKDTLVVGAFTESGFATGVNPGAAAEAQDGAQSSGAAYVFRRSGSTWTQEAYVKASNTGAGDLFGVSVAVAEDLLVVGATGEGSAATGVNAGPAAEADGSARAAGAAYVFARVGGVWTQQAYLKASNTEEEDGFGGAVAISDNVVVVGAALEDGGGTDAGAAYVFVRTGTTWTQTAFLKASNAGAFDEFGTAAAVAGDTVVLGAKGEQSSATGVNPGPAAEADDSLLLAGAVYVFR